MSLEIERKFLVSGKPWENAMGKKYVQGYISIDEQKVVRVRIAEENAFITIKLKSDTIARPEFEYSIPVEDASELLKVCVTPIIEKKRFKIPVSGKVWEIDVFSGDNEGLVIAEIELESEEEAFEKPDWVGEEVTHDPRYFNSSLSKSPFKLWKDQA